MKPGDIVVCINDQFNPTAFEKIPNKPKKGNYYYIREIREYLNDKIGVYLEEITNPKIYHNILGYVEPSFDINRFNKLDDLPEMEAIMEQIEELQEI